MFGSIMSTAYDPEWFSNGSIANIPAPPPPSSSGWWKWCFIVGGIFAFLVIVASPRKEQRIHPQPKSVERKQTSPKPQLVSPPQMLWEGRPNTGAGNPSRPVKEYEVRRHPNRQIRRKRNAGRIQIGPWPPRRSVRAVLDQVPLFRNANNTRRRYRPTRRYRRTVPSALWPRPEPVRDIFDEIPYFRDLNDARRHYRPRRRYRRTGSPTQWPPRSRVSDFLNEVPLYRYGDNTRLR